MLHTIRFQNATWQAPGDVYSAVGGGGFGYGDLDIASIGHQLHVVALSSGYVMHTIRFRDGSWLPWGDATTAAQAAGLLSDEVSCASIGGDLHVVVRAATT